MRFWDASALAPLLFAEAGTDFVRAWLAEDPVVVVWSLTRLELVSAIERRARERRLTFEERAESLLRVERLADDAHEVTDVIAVRARAIALLGRHSLRAADAAQLAAALLVAEADPSSLKMVVLDRRLAEAARRERLTVTTWPD